MADQQKRTCSVCEKPGVFLCSRCRDPYCSNKCQLNDWPQHKLLCFPIPHLIKAGAKPVVPPQKLEADLSICLPKKRHTQLAPLRKPKISANIVTDKATTANDHQLTKGYSFQNQFGRGEFYPGFQINEPFKSEEYPEIHTKKIPMNDQLQIAEDSALTVNLLNDDFIDLKIGRRGHLKPDNEVRISGTKLRQTKMEEDVSTKPSVAPSNLREVPLMTPSQPLSDPKSTVTSSALNEIWRQPSPVEQNVFVPVVVQFVTKDSQCVWVMLQKNETTCSDLLIDINSNISLASNVQDNRIEVNQLYLVKYEDIYYRGVSLELIRAGFVLVRLIDYGNEIMLPNDMLKEASPTIKNLNALAFQIKFERPRQVEVGDTLNIKIKSVSDDNVLNVEVETEKNFATKEDLEFIPIPIGVRCDLFILDVSNINRGYVSACVNDVKATNHIEEMNEKISAYCNCSDDSYHPHVNELCLAKYEDGEWYRAVPVEVIDAETFSIMFIDYGSTATIKSSDIRKMSEEFMHNCLMNVCFIKGAPEKPTDENIERTLAYFTENQVFSIASATKVKDAVLIDIPELQW